MTTAKVTDIAAVRAFKAALIEFEEEASTVLEAMHMELHRTLDWVENEQPAYWTKQVQVGFDKVAQARTQLNTCLMRTVAGRRPSCIEEKQNFEWAKRRLQHCQEMVVRVKQWSIKLAHESDEFRGRIASLSRCVENDLPRMIALIEKTASALERYAEVTGAFPTASDSANQVETESSAPLQDDASANEDRTTSSP